MMIWTFKQYFVEQSGRRIVFDWLTEMEADVEITTDFEMTLRHLAASERHLWLRPDFAPEDPPIWKIRISGNDKEFRLLGFFGPGRREFTVLAIAQEMDRQLVPRNSLEMAKQRMREVLANGRRARAFWFEE